ncbi:MAG: hypothetical protein ACKN9U_26490 [Pirellulaceae bacterium]
MESPVLFAILAWIPCRLFLLSINLSYQMESTGRMVERAGHRGLTNDLHLGFVRVLASLRETNRLPDVIERPSGGKYFFAQ